MRGKLPSLVALVQQSWGGALQHSGKTRIKLTLVKQGKYSALAGLCLSSYSLNQNPADKKDVWTADSNGCMWLDGKQGGDFSPKKTMFKKGDAITMEADTTGSTAVVNWM